MSRSHLQTAVLLDATLLTKRYAGFTAVAGLSFSVAPGEVMGLVGPNGCGKSTTLRMVVDLLEPDDGHVMVGGVPQGTVAARRQVAYVPDDPAGLDELSVAEYLMLVHGLYGSPAGVEARSARLLAAFGLDVREHSRMGTLSNGQRRLVTMVAAFALASPVVVIDEATAGLDPEAVIMLREGVRSLAERGSAVLLATQDLHFAQDACDRVTLLNRGELVAAGSTAELYARYRVRNLEEVFLAALGQEGLKEEIRDALGAD